MALAGSVKGKIVAYLTKQGDSNLRIIKIRQVRKIFISSQFLNRIMYII